jgi:hypothetical protein
MPQKTLRVREEARDKKDIFLLLKGKKIELGSAILVIQKQK